MKTRIFSVLLLTCLALLSSCKLVRQDNTPRAKGSNILEPNDNGEYEITIIDPGFDRWFLANAKPPGFYSPSYYEQKNRQYVVAWNEKVSQQTFYRSPNYPFQNAINYDPGIDYGWEVNYKLYYYFRYIEEVYGARYNFPI